MLFGAGEDDAAFWKRLIPESERPKEQTEVVSNEWPCVKSSLHALKCLLALIPLPSLGATPRFYPVPSAQAEVWCVVMMRGAHLAPAACCTHAMSSELPCTRSPFLASRSRQARAPRACASRWTRRWWPWHSMMRSQRWVEKLRARRACERTRRWWPWRSTMRSQRWVGKVQARGCVKAAAAPDQEVVALAFGDPGPKAALFA